MCLICNCAPGCNVSAVGNPWQGCSCLLLTGIPSGVQHTISAWGEQLLNVCYTMLAKAVVHI